MAIVVSLGSCQSYKYTKGNKTDKYYEEFFIKQGVMQYFVKPLLYTNDESKYTIDYTFRDSISRTGLVVINNSLYSDKYIKNIDSAFFVFSDGKLEIMNIKRMFIEKEKKKFEIRYSATITLAQMEQVFKNNHKISIFSNNVEYLMLPKKKTTKIYQLFDEKILEIIELNRN